MAAPERKFLHDIATPIATAVFLLDTLREDLAPIHLPESAVMEMVTQLEQALTKTRNLLTERREELIQSEKAPK